MQRTALRAAVDAGRSGSIGSTIADSVAAAHEKSCWIASTGEKLHGIGPATRPDDARREASRIGQEGSSQLVDWAEAQQKIRDLTKY